MSLLKIIARSMFLRQQRSSHSRGHPQPDYNFTWFFKWLVENDFKQMVMTSIESEDPNLTPSVDRKDPNKPYTKDNIQLVTWWENQQNNNKHRSVAVQSLTDDGVVIKEYASLKEAASDVDRDRANIRKAIQTGGRCAKIRWQYKKNPSP